MGNLEEDLRSAVDGDIHFDTTTRRIYSVDASIYEVLPIGVVIPRSQADLIEAVRIAHSHQVPIVPRGAATGIAGGCIGPGLIIDTSKYLNRILEINVEEGYAICEPGVVQDQLNAALSPLGYRLGPDTSTGNRATIGGMLGNNSSGARSLRYGKMVDHVEEVRLVLPYGQIAELKSLSAGDWAQKRQQESEEGKIYQEVWKILQEFRSDIETGFPKLSRRVAGYNLDELLKSPPLNLCKLVVGAEGSLGLVAEMKLKIVKKPERCGICILHFDDLRAALHHVPYLLTFKPLSLELIDDQIIKMGRLSPSMRGKLDWLEGEPGCLFVLEVDEPDAQALLERLEHIQQEITSRQITYAVKLMKDPAKMENVWSLRKAGLGLLLSRRSYSRAIGFVEDVAVAPEQLGSFMDKFLSYLHDKERQAGVYGHIGAGCVHVRPYINLRKEDDVQLMKQILLDTADLLLEHKGTLTGEHGDGYVRSWLNKKMFGDRLYEAFCRLKAAFDPEHLMNPDKVVHAPPLLHQLRLTPETKIQKVETFWDFSKDGGFELSVDLCNGNAQCRKREGLMCPSFQAYGDERHSTRARAQSLRAIVNGRLPTDALSSPELYQVLEYCLECKGCKTQCPSQVDMAKMKSEFLYHYHKKHGIPLRTRLFGRLGTFNQVTSLFPTLSNWMSGSRPSRLLLNKLGISPERHLPPLAAQRFSSWVAKREGQKAEKKVVLFNDTYTEFNYPEIGVAAVDVLEAMGYEVIVPPWKCCGRPLISKGLLPRAQRMARRLVDQLYPLARQGLPIIGLEPSCLSAFRDDYRDLLSGNQRQIVMDQSLTLDQFLAEEMEPAKLPLRLQESVSKVLLHTHCHQKALMGSQPTIQALKKIPGLEVEEIPSGCCGLAGSFGYEKEHYAMSMAIGEDKLFPAIRSAAPETPLVANGLSCRSQIAHGTGKRALHLAELLAAALRR